MVKKVFYVEKEKFLRSMIEVALKAKKAEIYTVETLENNFYLLSDLTPDLILFDLESVTPEEMKSLFEGAPKAKFVGLGKNELKEQLPPEISAQFSAFLPKPLVVFGLADRILALLD